MQKQTYYIVTTVFNMIMLIQHRFSHTSTTNEWVHREKERWERSDRGIVYKITWG